MIEKGNAVDGVLLTTEDQLDGDTAEEIASFIDDMNSTEHADAYITVLRIPTDSRGTPLPNSKHAGQLFHELLGRSTVNDVIERIRAQYIRPTETSITVRIIGKRPGERRLLFNRIYTIERANKSEAKPEGSVAEMLALMQANAEAQAQRTENFMREMLAMQNQSRVVAAPDPIDQMTKLMTAFAPVMAAVAGRPLPSGGGPNDLLATVKVLKEVNNMMGGGGGDENSSTMSVVKSVAEAVGPCLKFLAARAETERMTAAERLRRLPPPAQLPPPKPAQVPPKAATPLKTAAPKTNPPPKAAPANNPEGEDVKLAELREQIQVAAQLCDEGQSAEAVANLIVDNVEDEQLEELYRRVEPENCVAQLAVLAPTAVRGREKWFAELRLSILAQFEDDPDKVPAEGGGLETPEQLAADPVDLNSIPDAT